jgi:hypothetical protein
MTGSSFGLHLLEVLIIYLARWFKIVADMYVTIASSL